VADLDRPRDPARGALSLEIEANPNAGELGFVERGLFSFEEARLGNPNHAHFAIFVRDADGDVQGGVDCHVMWRRLFVKTLWLPEELRGQGLGSQLMMAAEAEGNVRRCRSVWLTALGDRACHFYRRLGYTIFGTHEDYVAGQALYSLRKELE
jgi:ribosomal protein S18 acetylase RimI-like enzyme